MLLVIDVGNTNITLGVFNGENLSATFRMTTKIQRTSDEYGIALNELIWHQGFEKSDIDACIVASVVPDIMHSLGSAMIKYFGIKPIVGSSYRSGNPHLCTGNVESGSNAPGSRD